MSFEALAWAGKCRPGSSSRKLVLFALADRHNDEVKGAYPSVAWIAEFTDLNRKTVIACLDGLEERGFISDSGERRGDTKQIKLYRLHLETVPKVEQSQKRNSTTKAPKQSQKRDTDTVRTTIPKKERPSLDMRPREKYLPPDGVGAQPWADFLASPKRRKAGMSATAYAGICGNLRTLAEHGFPPGEMVALAVERGWTTVKLEWVLNDGRSGTNGLGRHQSGGEARIAAAGRGFVGAGSAPG